MKFRWGWVILSLMLAACQHQVQVESSSVNDRAAVRTQLAAEYFKRRQFAISIEESKKALELSANYAPAYSMLALINMEIREDVQARQYFRKALELAPNNPDFHHNYGYFLCDRGQFREGVDEYLLTLKNSLYPTPEKSLLAAGGCAEKGGWVEEARGYYERALRYQPENSQAKYQIASLLVKSGDVRLARNYALELARLANPLAEYLWVAIRIERKLGNRESERRYAEQLRRLYPESEEVSKLIAGQYE